MSKTSEEAMAIHAELQSLDARVERVLARPRKGQVPPVLMELARSLEDLNREMFAIKNRVESRGHTSHPPGESEQMLGLLRKLRDTKLRIVEEYELATPDGQAGK